MMNPATADPANRLVISRLVSPHEADLLKICLVALKCRDVAFYVDTDDGQVWTCTVGNGAYRVVVTINGWNPESPLCMQIAGATPAAVARQTARIWPTELHIEHLLRHSATTTNNNHAPDK